MGRDLLIAGVAIALLATPAWADLNAGREKFTHGDYEEALVALEATNGKERFDAQLQKVEVLARMGRVSRAIQLATKLSRARGERGDLGTIALAKLQRRVGLYSEAKRALEPIAAADLASATKKNLRARYLLALVYRDIGQLDRGTKLFKSIYDDYQNQKLDEKRSEHLFYLAEAGRYMESFEFANGFYSDALARDPSNHAANIAWGHLLLFKYNIGDAEKSFDEVLRTDPNHPDAHAGMARVKLEQSYDLAAATYHLGRALKIDPNHIPALQIRAELETDKNQWRQAKATIATILSRNPKHTGARAQLATVHWLRDESAEFEKEKASVFAINPKFAAFFHIVARSAVREHRYRQAIELEREALTIDPSYYLAMAAVGTGYLRMGEEKEGLAWLRRAYEKDQYNVRTVNLLELFEKVIPRDYEFSTAKGFKFRLHKDERPIFERYIAPTLGRAFSDMTKRYGFEPKTPVVIELYRDPAHYSVRTVGLPNLGALGVCFGQVITARSPTVGDLNWGMILWHELAHVFAIQKSKSRVPRWYTEGLSEYETMIARPEWRRENDADLYSALVAGRIPSVAELNFGFMKPDMQEVVVAYYLSAVTMEYLAENYGFEKIVEGLELFGQGLETPEVIAKITGKSVEDFDKEFREYLERRLAPYRGTFRLSSSGFADAKALAKVAQSSPKKSRAWSELAVARFFDGEAGKAKQAAAKALQLDAKDALALYISGELALRARDTPSAKGFYSKMIAAGADGAEVRGRLGMIAAHEKNFEDAEKQFCAAKKLDPERSYPYQALADLYFEREEKDKAIAELEHYVYLEQMQYAPLKKLIDELLARKDWQRIRHYGEMAIFINPSDPDLLLNLGRAYQETGAAKKALFSYESALLTKPSLRRPALAHVGRAAALSKLGKKRAAIKATQKALSLEPNNAGALKLAEALGLRSRSR